MLERSKGLLLGVIGGCVLGLLPLASAYGQCTDSEFENAIKISNDGQLEVKRPLKGYSSYEKTGTTHKFISNIGTRFKSMVGTRILRTVRTDERNRVQSIDFYQWGKQMGVTPEFRIVMGYAGGACYIAKSTHRDGTLYADTQMCHELQLAEKSCQSSGSGSCENETQDRKLESIIKRHGGSLDNTDRVKKKFERKIDLKTVLYGNYQAAVYLERCMNYEPMRQALENDALWKTLAAEPALDSTNGHGSGSAAH